MIHSSAPDSSHDSIVELIQAARCGSGNGLGTLLERYRDYLLVIAHGDLHAGLRAKAGASDPVQETFLEAHRDFARFQGAEREEVLRWLRGILKNNLVDFARRYRTEAREVSRERPLQPGNENRSETNADLAIDTDWPPTRLMNGEQEQALRDGIDGLPEAYRLVVQLRHIEGLSWNETARRMGRSPDAVQKLWVRAILRLREQLGRG